MPNADAAAVYWFSGTGNSLAVARRLAAALGKAPIKPLAETASGEERAPIVGVVFPVRAFGLPPLVARFLARVSLPADAYVFTVATAGAVPGSVHREAAAILKGRGLDLAAGWTIRMPLNFSPVPIPCCRRRQDRLLEKASQRAALIGREVLEGRRGVCEDSPALVAWPLRALHRAAVRFLPASDRFFRVRRECSSCGLCARVCPTGNITFGPEGRPRWNGRCEACFACLQWCPVGAIVSGGPLPNRQRYRHPWVRAVDLTEQSPAESWPEAAEASVQPAAAGR